MANTQAYYDTATISSVKSFLVQAPSRHYDETPYFKNVNYCFNTNIYPYLETSGGQSSNLYLNAVHF
jgi:hypothetical protein